MHFNPPFTRPLQEKDLIPAGQALPVEIEETWPTASRWKVFVSFVALPSGFVIMLLLNNLSPAQSLLFALSFLGDVAAFWTSFWQWSWRRKWRFTPEKVHRWTSTFLGSSSITEYLRAYRGVRIENETRPTAEGDSQQMAYRLVLVHPLESSKNIELCISMSHERVYESRQRYADLLNVPVLETTPCRPPAHKLSVDATENTLTLVASESNQLKIVFGTALMFLGGVALLVGIDMAWFWRNAAFSAGGMLLFLGLLLILIPLVYGSTEKLRISPAGVSSLKTISGLGATREDMCWRDIEKMKVGRPEGTTHQTRLMLVGKGNVVHFGRSLTQPEQKWVCDCIQAFAEFQYGEVKVVSM